MWEEKHLFLTIVIPRHGFSGLQVLDCSLCQWNLDSQFQLLVGFRILWAVLRTPKPRVSDFTCKFFPDFGFRYMGRYKGWTIRKIKGRGWIFGRSMKVFFLPLRGKSIFPPRTAFLIMVRVETFFLLMRLPPPNLLSFFLMVTSLKVNGLEKRDLKAVKIGQILDRMMIAWTIAVISKRQTSERCCVHVLEMIYLIKIPTFTN